MYIYIYHKLFVYSFFIYPMISPTGFSHFSNSNSARRPSRRPLEPCVGWRWGWLPLLPIGRPRCVVGRGGADGEWWSGWGRYLVGGLEHSFFPFSWEWNKNPNWRTHIFQRGRYTTNQILYVYWFVSILYYDLFIYIIHVYIFIIVYFYDNIYICIHVEMGQNQVGTIVSGIELAMSR